MNQIEYLDLQIKIKNHFTWKRTQKMYSFKRLSPLIFIGVLLTFTIGTVFIQKYENGATFSTTFFLLFEKFSLPVFVFYEVIGFSLAIAFWGFMIMPTYYSEEKNLLDVLDTAYARNYSIEKTLYLPVFQVFYPCLDLDLTGETKTEEKSA